MYGCPSFTLPPAILGGATDLICATVANPLANSAPATNAFIGGGNEAKAFDTALNVLIVAWAI
jgi:hypothetical protein